MAKEIKVFSGSFNYSSGGTNTIYTVPAGRVAKVTIGTLFLEAIGGSFGAASVNLTAAGRTIISVSSPNNSTYVTASTSDFNAIFGTTTSNIHSPGSGQKSVRSGTNAWIIDSEFYLIAGNTVVVTGATGGPGSFAGIGYNFSAVEEF